MTARELPEPSIDGALSNLRPDSSVPEQEARARDSGDVPTRNARAVSRARSLTWYSAQQRLGSVPALSEEALDDFADEVVAPLGRIPDRDECVRLVKIYVEFLAKRNELRRRRRALLAASAAKSLDESPVKKTFESESARLRELLVRLEGVLSKEDFLVLIGSPDHWKPLCEVIGFEP